MMTTDQSYCMVWLGLAWPQQLCNLKLEPTMFICHYRRKITNLYITTPQFDRGMFHSNRPKPWSRYWCIFFPKFYNRYDIKFYALTWVLLTTKIDQFWAWAQLDWDFYVLGRFNTKSSWALGSLEFMSSQRPSSQYFPSSSTLFLAPVHHFVCMLIVVYFPLVLSKVRSSQVKSSKVRSGHHRPTRITFST